MQYGKSLETMTSWSVMSGRINYGLASSTLSTCNNTLLISNGFASMGFALPAAITAKLLYSNKKVVAVCGDGGFLMNVHEIETASRLGLNIVIIIFRLTVTI